MTFELLTSEFYGSENLLTDQEKATLTELRAYLESEVRPIVNGYWERAEFPLEVIKPLAKLGADAFAWEEIRPFTNSAVFRGFLALELARVDASVATFVGMQHGLVVGSISLTGSKEQRDEWLPKLASGEVIGAFALTEPLSGSDAAQGLRTVATRDGDNWVLNGQKRWLGNGTISDITIVWAKDAADGQVKGFIVPTDTAGYTAMKIEGKISLRSVQNADITLENVLVQDLLVKCLGNITASIGMVVRVSQMLDDGTQRDEHSALAKAYTTSRAREMVAWCRELFVGNGIVLSYDVARFFADAGAIYSYEGTQEMNTLIVGRTITGKAAFA